MTGFTPKQAMQNAAIVSAKRLAAYGRKYKDTNKSYLIGDRVRRRLTRPKFTKGHVPYWSRATYRIIAKKVPANDVVALTLYKIALWDDETKIRRGVYNTSSLQGPIKAVEYRPDHVGDDEGDDSDSDGDGLEYPGGVNEDDENEEEPLLDPRVNRRPTAVERQELDELERTRGARPRNARRRQVT